MQRQLHDVEAETLQRTRLRKAGCRNPTNLQVCGPRQPPTVQKTLQIQRFHAECCKTQVLGPYQGGWGGGPAGPGPAPYILQLALCKKVFACFGFVLCSQVVLRLLLMFRNVPRGNEGTSPPMTLCRANCGLFSDQSFPFRRWTSKETKLKRCITSGFGDVDIA